MKRKTDPIADAIQKWILPEPPQDWGGSGENARRERVTELLNAQVPNSNEQIVTEQAWIDEIKSMVDQKVQETMTIFRDIYDIYIVQFGVELDSAYTNNLTQKLVAIARAQLSDWENMEAVIEKIEIIAAQSIKNNWDVRVDEDLKIKLVWLSRNMTSDTRGNMANANDSRPWSIKHTPTRDFFMDLLKQQPNSKPKDFSKQIIGETSDIFFASIQSLCDTGELDFISQKIELLLTEFLHIYHIKIDSDYSPNIEYAEAYLMSQPEKTPFAVVSIVLAFANDYYYGFLGHTEEESPPWFVEFQELIITINTIH